MIRRVMLVWHKHRPDAQTAASVMMSELDSLGVEVVEEARPNSADLLLALGGDGTILAAAEYARRCDVPLLGVNLGHMGFLAEATDQGFDELAQRIANEDFHLETRMTLDVVVRQPDGTVMTDWALNEAVVIHTDVAHPVHLALAVDGQDVSTYGADGIVLATPTGSTAYSFSAGGPVVWPDMEAIVMAPLAAHGLFTRPLVVGPSSKLEVGVLSENWTSPELWCDGKRRNSLPPGSSVTTTVGQWPVRLVRLDDTPFSTRLVQKFNLPTRGWRNGRNRSVGK